MTLTYRVMLAVVLLLTTFASAADSPFDLVITNGHIIDGTGSPWYSGDVGIRDGRIAAIGNLSAAARKRTIDAKGKVRSSGLHRHARPVGDDHSRRSAPALENLSGHHDRDYGRGRIRCSLE